jgi:GNAT superfamily N-acetyltransferase
LSSYSYSHIKPTDEDARALVALGAEMHAESSYSDLEFSPKRVLETFNWYLGDENKTAILARKGETPVGLYAGYISKYYFSDDTVANDIAWFVTKPLRGTRVGLRLLDKFEDWALSKGVKEVRIGYSTDINPKAFGSLMAKRGYQVVGANYRLENKQ